MATNKFESSGIDTATPITPEGCAMVRMIATTMRKLEAAGGDSKCGPAESVFNRVVLMLWGSGVFEIPEDEREFGAYPEPDYRTDGTSPEGVKPVESGIVTMSLKGLRDTGRCSADELVRMSIASPRDRRLFIKSRAPIPAGTFPVGVAHAEAKAEAVAAWALGKGLKPE